jgi:hypothetical protein
MRWTMLTRRDLAAIGRDNWRVRLAISRPAVRLADLLASPYLWQQRLMNQWLHALFGGSIPLQPSGDRTEAYTQEGLAQLHE